MSREPLILPWAVGDRALVRRGCLTNPPASIALCVEVYTLAGSDAPADGVTLIFANGQHDGFSQADLGVFHVQRGDRIGALRAYEFANVSALRRDFGAGTFARAFTTLIRGNLTPPLTPIWRGYPLECWPACPACGDPAIEGLFTCGRYLCGPESRWRG